ncbi:MAG TPA: metal-sensing transcriptional repressor [Burkholderiaceae bacterium]|nr:metal-sensing transcriptional repressor [Burkholderiaceae bacterium]HQR70920.1 metal-sensing transcriptional repressor [Burkholderiaceae bacterium]
MPARKAAENTTPESGADRARRELLLRLKRVEGQLRGIQRMIEAGEDCEPIAQQLSASRKALDKAFFELLACAIEHPEFTANPKEPKDRRIERMARALARLA